MSVFVVLEGRLRSAPAGARRWLYAGESPLWALRAQQGALAGLERVASEQALHARAATSREAYLDWIADLGVRNDSLDWWASELAAKNVYTFLFQRLCAAGAALDLLEDGLVVVCSTPALAQTVAAGARDRGFDVRMETQSRPDPRRLAAEAAHALLHGAPRRRPTPPGPSEGETLLVTWVDERSFDERGAYRDPHLGPLAAMLRERGERVTLLARMLPAGGRARTLRLLRACGERSFLPDSFLTPGDWRACVRRARAFDPAIDQDASVGGVRAAPLARELVGSQRVSHAGALTYDLMVARMVEAGVRPARIVIPWEGHAWESALIWATRRRMPGTPVIAYENLNFSSFALSLYPGEAELGARPLPDRVVANGPTFARSLAASAFPAERVRVGCALRHAGLYVDGSLPEPIPRDPEFVLAAGSIDAGQTVEMVHAAYEAFGGGLLVKLHPASDMRAIRSALPGEVAYSEQPIGELLPRARAMIYTYSIVPYEALAAGVPPVFFRSQALVDLDQLEPTPDVRWTAASPGELREVLGEALQTAATAEWRERARLVVREALAPCGPGAVEAFLGDGP